MNEEVSFSPSSFSEETSSFKQQTWTLKGTQVNDNHEARHVAWKSRE